MALGRRRLGAFGTLLLLFTSSTPFLVRAVEGTEVFGNDAPSIIAKLFLAALSVWEWWCLCEAFAWQAMQNVIAVSGERTTEGLVKGRT